MASSKNRVRVPGSSRQPVPGARLVGAADPNEKVLVTMFLRRRSADHEFRSLIQHAASHPVHRRQHLRREEFAAAHGAHPDDLSQVRNFAREYGLDVVEEHTAQRRVLLSGTVNAVSAAFGVDLARYDYPGGSYRGRIGEVQIPDDLAPAVEAVMGLDNRPQALPHFRSSMLQPRAQNGTFTPPQVGQLYDFPTGVDGTGQCLGIIELGGGYNPNDLQTYFQGLPVAIPNVQSVSVDGANNQPTGDPRSDDGEVVLDIEVAGAVAPGATIAVYFAPNTDAGFLDAVKAAIHDNVNKPSVISISWGNAESQWTQQAMQAMDQAFQDAAALGVTICVAAGDNGSSDLSPRVQDDGLLHADFPCSSPFALACGGTLLQGSGSSISNEAVWNKGKQGGATGGGISDVFDPPSWQAHAGVPSSANPGGRIGRGVPDVAGDADPASGYQVLVDGQAMAYGGTSAVAPLWAGLIALMNQQLGHPVGYLNPVLYGLAAGSGAFNDITSGNNDISGNNGAYQAGAGWDACTGLGSPDGAKLLASLSGR